jgi:hypothetical protein
VIPNRSMAARDILSGTIHKLTLWLDDVRRKPAMTATPETNCGSVKSGYGTERRLTR